MAEEQKDWYSVLGVERTATTKEIAKAYKLKALKYHPDKNPDPNAAKIFHDVSQAYDLLLDPAARAAFDNLLNVKVQAQERANKYDSTRRKMKEDLESKENAFRKQKQEEKLATLRMELEESKSLETTLKLKWKKKKHAFDADMLTDIFSKYGAVDSCVSKNQRSALISFKTLTGAYKTIKASEKGDTDLEMFTITWAAGVEPVAVSSMRANDTSSSHTSASPPGSGSQPSSVGNTISGIPPPAFNVAPSTTYTPAFSIPSISGKPASFGGFPTQIPSFGSPPSFGTAAPFMDDYEAATLAKMKNKDNERKRLAEEMMRQDQEEEERLQAMAEEKKRKV
ncbi:DnaJ (Hsp40), sub C, member 17 [Mortierella sp. AD094]|nr:DnaJ (Hsp40), sub C, member 17 [Mortierella sp. AD094]